MIDQRPAPLRKLRYLVSGGDVMSPAHVAKAARLLNSGHFISVYGPTENTTFTTTFTAPPDLPADAPVPIGWPVASTTLRILDDEMRAVPEGAAGQLYAGGAGLALGYLNAPDLTQQKFIADPDAPAQTLYRTGGLVRRDETGLLHFLGRMDNQIKVNGRRIEPEHVEAVLRRHLALTDIAVVACILANGAKHLVAFVVPLPGASLSDAVFRAAANRYLPPHMIPARLSGAPAISASSAAASSKAGFGKNTRRGLRSLQAVLASARCRSRRGTTPFCRQSDRTLHEAHARLQGNDPGIARGARRSPGRRGI